MMDIDEAIRHAEKVANEKEREIPCWIDDGWKTAFKNLTPEREAEYKAGRVVRARECKKCAEEHRQIAEWLRELKRLRNQERPDTEWLWMGEQPDGTRWWCRNCGRHVKETTEFCPYCGGDARMCRDLEVGKQPNDIRKTTEENLQDTIVGGYFIRDLIVTAERLRKEGVDPHKLRMSCDDFLEGYKTAHEEIHRQIEKSVQDMLGNIRELPTEERPKTDGGEEDERQNKTGD